MPRMKVMDLGIVEVRRLPKKIPKTMTAPILGGRVKIDRDTYKLLWASKYATAAARKKVLKTLC
jgi:hypothetical protein